MMLIALFLLLLIAVVSLFIRKCKRARKRNIIAFYHPFCSSGGGGERVLWKIIEVLSRFQVHVVIYTVDAETPTYLTDLLRHVHDRFSLVIPLDTMQLSFVHLPQHKHLLQPAGSFSLLQESLGAMRLAYYGLVAVPPSLYIDTTGAAFSFLPAFVLFGCRVMAYVHYPTISTDMLQLVWDRRFVSDSQQTNGGTLKSYAKLVYYIFFAGIYGAIGSLTTTLVLVNSTWTYHHIRSLWRGARDVRIVYPPCSILTSSRKRPSQPDTIVSVGQFRPEKDHALQIRAVQRLKELHPDVTCRLVLLGSCRNDEDAARLEALRTMANAHSNSTIEFVVNAPSATLQEWLTQKAHVGLHTMWNEHFGIGIVEMMAAGLLVVAHKSGGPQTDIVEHARSGFLASTVDQYAEALYTALTMPPRERATMQCKAQESAERFTDEVFEEAILKAIGDLHVIRR